MLRLLDKNKRLRIRCGQGIGDSIYLQAVVASLLAEGYTNLEACTNYPEIFEHLSPRRIYDVNNKLSFNNARGRFDIIPFTRSACHVIAHYTGRKRIPGTSQMEDCYISAGWSKDVSTVDPSFGFHILDSVQKHVDALRKSGKLIIVYQNLRAPMGRSDGFGFETIPSIPSVRAAIKALPDHKLIKIGQGDSDDIRADEDLTGKTSISESISYFCAADIIIGQCSWIIPLAECRKIPLIVLFGHRIRSAEHQFIRSISPEKLLLRHKRNGNLELGLWDDDSMIEQKVKTWESGLVHAHQN